MEKTRKIKFLLLLLCLLQNKCESAKINKPRVLLPWFENLYVSFTFEIIEGGCYTWSLSRDDIIDLVPLYEDKWGHCSRAARVSVSRSCVPPGSVIILAEEVNTGEILRGDVDIDIIKSLKVMSTTWKLYLEEAPEAFEVVAYDDQGNKFSTLEGVQFTWSIENLGNTVGEDLLVTLVRWRDTDYEAPPSITELEAQGHRSYSVLLYGQAMGAAHVRVCLNQDQNICTDFTLQVVASVVLTPATAMIAPGDTVKYRVVRARAGRLTIQDIGETTYTIKVPEASIARLEDTHSLVKGSKVGVTSVILMSGVTEVASATLTVAEPHSIRVNIRPSNLVIRDEEFLIQSIMLDKNGHALTAGSEILIRLTVEGEANVELLQSTENGTLTDAIAQNAGNFKVIARLHSVGGKFVSRKVEGEAIATAVEPLEVVPPELFVAWTDIVQEVTLKHRGGGSEPVTWSEKETPARGSLLSLTHTGAVTIRGPADIGVQVQLANYPHVKAYGRVWSLGAEYIQASGSGHARVGRPYHLHVALTATHPDTGVLFNFHTCNCASFAISLLEGPEPLNVTAATWATPAEGACCVVEMSWATRGVSTIRVSRGRIGDTARIAVRAAPTLVWPKHAAAVVGSSIPVLAEGESLTPESSDPRVAELTYRDDEPPLKHPDMQLFTFKCRRKGDARMTLFSDAEDERESVEFEAACAPHVSKIRLEPEDVLGNCSGGPRIWLMPGQETVVKVTLFDAVGRELMDEEGHKMKWEIEPYHAGILYEANKRVFIDTIDDYDPVPVPDMYYQVVQTSESAIGWSGSLKAHAPEAVASIPATVVAPLVVEPVKVNLAWEGESISNIATVTGGSGRYSVESPSGVSGSVEGGVLSVSMPGPGTYDVTIVDQCVDVKQVVEVHIEEILTVEVSTSRAVGVGACVALTALVRGVSQRYLTVTREPQWRTVGDVIVKDGQLCGVAEGTGRVRAALGGVWSSDVEVIVFPGLELVPSEARVPPGARLQLRARGGPPSHIATLQYKLVAGFNHVEVSQTGTLHGIAVGTSRVKLVATDIDNVEMASAEAEVEVIPISGVRVRAYTQTVLVGEPTAVWVEAGGLPLPALAALTPAPKVTFSLRDDTIARLYTSHADDKLERSVAEGLTVRVVPLKPGLITIDVRVRNMGQVAETRSWDSTIEILAISDIKTIVEGLPSSLKTGQRLAVAAGNTLRLKSMPRVEWEAHSNGAFDITPNGELNALKPGHGVLIGHHRDERNNIYRETAIHVEVAIPHYCTVEPASNQEDDSVVRVVLRNSVGRPLLAPDANVTVESAVATQIRRSVHSALGSEVLVVGLEAGGALVSMGATAAGVTLTDHVWLALPDTKADRVSALGGWGVCVEGVGWRAPEGVTVLPGSGVSLAILKKDISAKHVLRLDRAFSTFTIIQHPIQKMVFQSGEWPAALVPLSIEATGVKNGPLICAEDQKYALEGLQVELPFTCRTKAPHTAAPVMNIEKGQIGCSVLSAAMVTEASEVELCAEWDAYRTCTKVLLLPPIKLSQSSISLLEQPTTFTITGHPHALRMLKFSTSPGLKIELVNTREGDITVVVKSETTGCGLGWINVFSRLTAQEYKVEVERDCEIACGTLLGAIFSIIRPYISTLFTLAAVVFGILYVQSRLPQKNPMHIRVDSPPTVMPVESPSLGARRSWSRSPRPAAPIYGDGSVLPDNSFSPNSTRMHSRFPNSNSYPSLIDMTRLSTVGTQPQWQMGSYVTTNDFTQRFL